MLKKEIKYSYNDISIVPDVISYVKHRSECNVFENGKLPIFTAPMSSVIDESNFDVFEEKGIRAILPRTVDLNVRVEFAKNGKWASFGLDETKKIFIENTVDSDNLKVLIDIANGHMDEMLSVAKDFKEKYKTIKNELMVGNIANPNTYRILCVIGVDYVRCGIGGGEGCITSSNLGVHYPMASLIDEIAAIKRSMGSKFTTKVIADGGIRNYRDAIKALALGADYVMIGGLFSRMFESAGEKYFYNNNDGVTKIIPSKIEKGYENNFRVLITRENGDISTEIDSLFKEFYGMASKKAQKEMHGKKVHTSEGLVKEVRVNMFLDTWVENFIDYLRSAMSYTNAKDLDYFRKNTNTIVISNNTFNSVNK